MSLVDHDELAILLGWFDDNLPVPKRFNRTKSKGWSRRNTKGISWFKVSANEYVSKAQRIKSILNNYGIEVREVRSFRPGFITHEDSIQVVAEPFAATAGVS